VYFFFQAEDGIRDDLVTGVQTCALPISVISGLQSVPPVTAAVGGIEASQLSEALLWARTSAMAAALSAWQAASAAQSTVRVGAEIGRASCRERGERVAGSVRGRQDG